MATRADGPGRANPARTNVSHRPFPGVPGGRFPGLPGGQPVGVNVANAVSRSVRHSSPSHSSTLQLIMIE
ncbi:hypothetical protein GCM10010342_68080 [Streptomyces anulatus]|nr:hypothetical protein GCM10010342_68080 [Streptomyces anulatus]